MKIYPAGPDVFLPDAIRKLCFGYSNDLAVCNDAAVRLAAKLARE